jgi:integrase
MLLLLRLGLRAGDIASMRPADIDWQEATLLVRGTGWSARPWGIL